MMTWFIEQFEHLMSRGGPVMWPLLLLSMLAMALVFERCWFWIRLNHPWRLARVGHIGQMLGSGDMDAAAALAKSDSTLYGRLVVSLLDRDTRLTIEQAMTEYRAQLERFLPILSTIITACPMLGILGTVLGIISSFEVLTEQADITDPRSVGSGIAQALITTAFGLSIAIAVVFPFNVFRAQVDRTLTRMESLVSMINSSSGSAEPSP